MSLRKMFSHILSSRKTENYELLSTSPVRRKKSIKTAEFWRLSFITLILFDLLLVIISLIVWQRWRVYVGVPALDNFQHLNTLPMIDPAAFNSLALSKPQPYNPEEHAVVSTMYTDNYILPVTTLGYTLQENNITARRILMYIPERVSRETRCLAQAAGWELFPVDFIAPPKGGVGTLPHYRDQYTKLNLWTLDTLGIKSLVYLDADTIVRKNFDELFTLPYTLAATPDIWLDARGFTVGFNAGLLLVRPSTEVFLDMLKKIETAEFSLAFAEQAFLNAYFGSQVLRLPLPYNGNIAIKYKSRVLWDAMKDDLRVVHYTLTKPFPGKIPLRKGQSLDSFFQESLKAWGGVWKEELLWWGDASKKAEAKFGKESARCIAGEYNNVFAHEI